MKLPQLLRLPRLPRLPPFLRPESSPRRRVRLWAALMLLLLVAQSLLVALTAAFESSRAQDLTDAAASEAAADVKRGVTRAVQDLQSLVLDDAAAPGWAQRAQQLMQTRRELLRVEHRNAALQVTAAADSPIALPLFSHMARADLAADAALACAATQSTAAPVFSHSYYVPMRSGLGVEVVDLCLPVFDTGQIVGYILASFSLAQWLDAALDSAAIRRHELSFVEGDGARLARAGAPRGAGIYVAERLVDLPGQSLLLRADNTAGRPSLIPNLAVALVLGLSMALFALVLILARDVRRRAQAEHALAEALAFRKAMEDSLSTGLRARDLQGRITYANPAFCQMVGFSAEDLRGAVPPPYWPPEQVQEYTQRQAERLQLSQQKTADGAAGTTPTSVLAGTPNSSPARSAAVDAGAHHAAAAAPAAADANAAPAASDASGVAAAGSGGGAGLGREGFETVFVRRNGERFPVMIYEAPLVDGSGAQTGWMSAVLDVSEQRRVEEFSRQQQERLQASARLATVGEMASLLSHELNQPLAAIASYAHGSLNLLDAPDAQTPALLKQGLGQIATQAERAGHVIKSVHDFVRRREHHHEATSVQRLFDAVLPLVRLQARKSGARIEVDLPPGRSLMLRCDRTMVEQVLLNLARNGMQAMEADTPLEQRVLTLAARQTHERWITLSVSDVGAGIDPDVAAKLFTPFYSTRIEGMGLGLSLCRTVIEQHGGALDFESPFPPMAQRAVQNQHRAPEAVQTAVQGSTQTPRPNPAQTPAPGGAPCRGTQFRFTLAAVTDKIPHPT